MRSVVFKVLAFLILATTKWRSLPTYTNFLCLIYTAKKMSEMLITSFFMVLNSRMKPIFGLACHMLILFFNYVKPIQFTFC